MLSFEGWIFRRTNVLVIRDWVFWMHPPCWRAINSFSVPRWRLPPCRNTAQTTATFSNKSFSLLQFLVIRFAMHKTLLKENLDFCHSWSMLSGEKNRQFSKENQSRDMKIYEHFPCWNRQRQLCRVSGKRFYSCDNIRSSLHVISTERKTEI